MQISIWIDQYERVKIAITFTFSGTWNHIYLMKNAFFHRKPEPGGGLQEIALHHTTLGLLCNVSNALPHCCVPSGWSWCAVGWFGLSCSGSRWTLRPRRPCRSPWRASLPHNSVSGTRASPSRFGERDPSRTGTRCWSRCTGRDRFPRLQTCPPDRVHANPQSRPAHRRVLEVQVRAAAWLQPRSARTHPQNCIKLLTRHIYHADRLTQQVSGYPRRNSPVCPDSRRQRGWKYPSLKENFPLLQARSLTSWCPGRSDVTDGWKRSGPRARGSSARTGFSCACRHRIRGAAGQSASGIPFRGQRQRHTNTISDSEFSTINHDEHPLQHKIISKLSV